VLDIKHALQQMDPNITRAQTNKYLAQGTQHSAKTLKWDTQVEYEQFMQNLRNTLVKKERNWNPDAQPVISTAGWPDPNEDDAGTSDSGASADEAPTDTGAESAATATDGEGDSKLTVKTSPAIRRLRKRRRRSKRKLTGKGSARSLRGSFRGTPRSKTNNGGTPRARKSRLQRTQTASSVPKVEPTGNDQS